MKFWLCLIVSHNKILCSKLKIFQDENVRMNEGAKENIWSLRKLKLKCSQCYCTLLKLRQLVCVFQVSIFFFLGSKGKKRKVKMSRLKQLTSKTVKAQKNGLYVEAFLCVPGVTSWYVGYALWHSSVKLWFILSLKITPTHTSVTSSSLHDFFFLACNNWNARGYLN